MQSAHVETVIDIIWMDYHFLPPGISKVTAEGRFISLQSDETICKRLSE